MKKRDVQTELSDKLSLKFYLKLYLICQSDISLTENYSFEVDMGPKEISLLS